MGYRYCVFGANHRGITRIHDLIRFCDAEEVLVCESDIEKYSFALKQLKNLLGEIYCEITWVSSPYIHTIPKIDWHLFIAIIDCAPIENNLELSEFAADRNIPLIIDNDLVHVTENHVLRKLQKLIKNIEHKDIVKIKCDRCNITIGLHRHSKGWRCPQCIWNERENLLKLAKNLLNANDYTSPRDGPRRVVVVMRKNMDALAEVVEEVTD